MADIASCKDAAALPAKTFQDNQDARDYSDDARGWRSWAIWRVLSTYFFHPRTLAQKLGCTLIWLALFTTGIVLFAVIFPRFLNQVIDPFVAVVTQKLTPLQIGAMCTVGIVLLPMLLLPFTFLIWTAALALNFWVACAVVFFATTVGKALPFLLARHIMHRRAEAMAQRSPKLMAAVRVLDMAGPWKVVLLVRLGPVPYPICNYALAVPPSISFWVYMVASVLAQAPLYIFNIFFGQNVQGIADLLRGRVQNPWLLAWNLIALIATLLFVLLSIWYARKVMEQLTKAQAAADAAVVATDVELGGAAGAGSAGGNDNSDMADAQVLVVGSGKDVMVTGTAPAADSVTGKDAGVVVSRQLAPVAAGRAAAVVASGQLVATTSIGSMGSDVDAASCRSLSRSSSRLALLLPARRPRGSREGGGAWLGFGAVGGWLAAARGGEARGGGSS